MASTVAIRGEVVNARVRDALGQEPLPEPEPEPEPSPKPFEVYLDGRRPRGDRMSGDVIINSLFVFALAGFLGSSRSSAGCRCCTP
ncbi:MAG: hypothetical protein U0Y82_01970 [Thermoleophilia bacterium]